MVATDTTQELTADGRFGGSVQRFRERGWWQDGSAAAMLDRWAADCPARGETLEAMKMEHTIVAPVDGTVTEVAVAPGDQVDTGQVLVVVDDGAALDGVALLKGR